MEDLISIIIPVYNVEKYVGKCLESICNQTYKNIEVIVIDDGSTDDSGRICDKWAKKDNRVRVIHQKNKGVSYSRNKGLELASGKYIGFIDSDDYIDEDMYEFLYYNMMRHKAEISICSTYHLYEDGTIKHDKIESIDIELSNIDGLICIFKTGYYGTGMCNKLFSKKLLKNNQFNTTLSSGEELNVLFNAIKNSNKIYYSSQPKYYYLQRIGSATHQKKINTGMMKNFKNIINLNREFIENNEKLKDTIISHYILACFQVYNRFVLYNDNKYKEILIEMKKYRKNINYSNYNKIKRIQLFLFYTTPNLYYSMLKVYSRFCR